MGKRLKIATRQSELALWQANHAAGLLRGQHPGLEIDLLPLVTRGDRILNRSLASIGGKGLFLKELERALLNGDADLAVHSMKDVPVHLTPGLRVDVVLERANPFDALVSRSGATLDELPAGARIGTSSLRRQCQLRHRRPDLRVLDLRGNVKTRVARLQQGQYEAIILACAGLQRLGLDHLVSETLGLPDWLPAVTQGSICLQYPESETRLAELLRPLNHAPTAMCSTIERKVSEGLEGSCQLPLAVYARMENGCLALDALLGTPDGKRVLRCARRGDPSTAMAMADDVVADLLQQGGGDIITGLSQPPA